MEESQQHEESRKSSLWEIYDKQYKKLLIIPILLLVLALAQIGYQSATTGDFVHKGVSLKGGVTLTVPQDTDIDVVSLERKLLADFPGKDMNVRALSRAGRSVGFVVEADIDVSDQQSIDKLFDSVDKAIGAEVRETEFTLEAIGSTLGESFFREIIRILAVAFLFMGAVVFLYFGKDVKSKLIVIGLTILDSSLILGFRNQNLFVNILVAAITILTIYYYLTRSMPSFAVIAAAASDIIITVAIVNVIGMRISAAGIAAFLMLIGYSVDTDILLSTKVLKSKTGSIMDRVKIAMKTGLMMTVTTVSAVFVAYTFTQSEVIKQIMLILLIGLAVDVINTWIQNVGLLRLYLEKRKSHEG